MEFTTIKQQRLYMQVAEQILLMARDGTIKVGERLPSERDLAEKLGVSRPSIREAMIAMEMLGVVEVRSGSGVYVIKKPSSTDVKPIDTGAGPFEILEARLAVEGEAAALAAERINKNQLAELRKLLKTMESKSQDNTAQELADEEFHLVVAEASGNSVLAATVEWLWKLRNESEISQLFHQRLRDEGVHPIIKDHQSVYDALAASDSGKARKAMHKHLTRVIDSIITKSKD